MANINVVVEKTIADGYKLKFRTPCDSTAIEGLEVKYPAQGGIGTLIKKFVFKDAHGTELSGVGNLFVGGVMIEVLLDVTHSVAYIQNADTNSYVESVKGEIKRLEEAQKQFLSVAGEVVEDCEQALTATQNATEAANQATNTLVLTHNDLMNGGYIKALKELNAGNKLTFWIGTMDEYKAIPEKVNNCLYITTDDVTMGDIREELEKEIEKKAPAGYGGFGEIAPSIGTFGAEESIELALGGQLQQIEVGQTKRVSFDTIDSATIAGAAVGEWSWLCSIYKSSSNYAIITAESGYGGRVTKLTKAYSNGVWQPFEWENPPMIMSNHYRTTERFDDKPVYVKYSRYTVDGETSISLGLPDGATVVRHYAFTDIATVTHEVSVRNGVLAMPEDSVAAYGDTISVTVWYTKD